MNIAISGGCNSGKTTFINKFKAIAPDDVVTFPELVRDKNIISIDDIRKDANKYLEFEVQVIREKIQKELECENKFDNKICLFDRSLIDSYFYFTNYINYSDLTPKNKFLYDGYKIKLENAIEYFINNVYDKIVFFKPIREIEISKYRPVNLETVRAESAMIRSLLDRFVPNKKMIVEFDVTTQTIDDFVHLVQADAIRDSHYLQDPVTFIKYHEQGKFLTFNEIVMNTYGSVDPSFDCSNEILGAALLYTSDKSSSDEILNQIKSLKIEANFMNSRCYPTGLWFKRNIMVVGEAPGQYGRSIKPEYLKPSFIFAMTSWVLRRTISEIFRVSPYITNLLKYARSGNKVTTRDFDVCRGIFEAEVTGMKPRCIIALGYNVYKYLSAMPNLPPVVLARHPAAIVYTGESIEEYITRFRLSVSNIEIS